MTGQGVSAPLRAPSMLNKSERDARCIEVWVGVLGVASDCLQKVMNRVEAMERMRQSYVRNYELQRPHGLYRTTHTVVGWRAGENARLRAEGAREIVRARRVETAYKCKIRGCKNDHARRAIIGVVAALLRKLHTNR